MRSLVYCAISRHDAIDVVRILVQAALVAPMYLFLLKNRNGASDTTWNHRRQQSMMVSWFTSVWLLKILLLDGLALRFIADVVDLIADKLRVVLKVDAAAAWLGLPVEGRTHGRRVYGNQSISERGSELLECISAGESGVLGLRGLYHGKCYVKSA